MSGLCPSLGLKMWNVNREIVNSTILGTIFMVLYSAFYALSNLEELIINNILKENPRFKGDAFTNLSVLYASFALFIWFAPPVIGVIGPKWTLTLGTVGFCIQLVSLLLQQGWLLYASSVFNGAGAAMLWTAQAVYVMFNSTPSTVARNSAIFAAICHSSMIYGNLFAYFCFDGKTGIDRETRTMVLFGLLGLTVLAMVIATFLPDPVYIKDHEKLPGSALQDMKRSWSVATTKHMLLLTPMFLYSGVQLSYLSGVFGAAVGFTKYSDGYPSNRLVTVTGASTGIGEVISGVFLFFANPLLSSRSWPLIVTLGVFTDCLAFLLTFLNYSDDSVLAPTADTAIIGSWPWVAIIIAVLLGFSDGLFMPMLLSLIKKIYPNGNASTLTVYTFGFSFGAAVSFFYSDFVSLYWQLLINSLAGIFGLLSYCFVNRMKVSTSIT